MAVRMAAARKWRAVFSLHIQDSIAYRAQGIVWILTDTVPTITMPLMWLAAYGSRHVLNGFTKSGMVAYFLAMSVVANLVTAHPWEISRDIKEGRLSVYLTRPFSYYSFQFASNLSWRLVRTVLYVPFFALVLLIFRPYLVWGHYNLGAALWASVLLGHLLSFQLSWLLAMVAFYLVEVSGIFEFYYMFNMFLAGQVAPLQMLPPAVRHAAQSLPFAYVQWFPVEIFLGNVSGSAVRSGLITQLVWIGVLWVAGRMVWNHGLKRYTAVGI